MFSFLKSRGFLLFVGFVLLALFIWYAGPYFAFADFRPLDGEIARLVCIALVVVAWAVWALVKRLKANRASDQLVAAVVKQAAAENRPSAEAVQLRERFEEAVATLKEKRRGGHSLYDLPWYVIIGAPGSGKTTALVNSGLKFPLEQRSGKGALRGVGGTRNCDWWFTDEAVFLDTAGRYTTQDSDASSDSSAWSEFLSLLCKYRKRRPVNGVILTISAQDLMVQGQTAREAHVAAARRRLIELNKELRIQPPVYLFVTKCDLVSGFTEYFDDLTQEGRAQVWGVTFPFEQTVKGDAARAFPAEFDALVTRLNARLFGRLEAEHDARRRTRVFGFPQQLAAVREPLTDFVTEVFASTRFDSPVLLRGVYFTSGTQEGTPIDRLLGSIGRRFGVAPDAVAAPPGRGKAYFIERLLKDVLLAESGLAGVNRRFEIQKAAAELGAYAAMALIAVLGVIWFTVSYNRNRSYVDELGTEVAALKEVPPVPERGSLEMAMPRLDAVRAVADSANRYHDGAPFAMRAGLFQGYSFGNAATDAYLRELDGALLPRVAARFKQRLIDYAPQPEILYLYLKAYLMLGDPNRVEKEHLRSLADQEFEEAYTASPEIGQALSKHFATLLDSEKGLRAVPLDDTLVTQARNTIQQASIPRLMYGQTKILYANDPRGPRLDLAAGLGAEQVLRRGSNKSLSEPLPALFTKEVFNEVTGKGTVELVAQFSSESWVWGENKLPLTATAKLGADMIEVYEQEYIAAWEAVLKEIGVVPFQGLPATSATLAKLAAPTSPLRGVLKLVDEHTYLVAPPDPKAPAAGITKKITGLINRGKQAAGVTTVPPGTGITQHFAPLHAALAGPPGGAKLDVALGKLAVVQQTLDKFGNPGQPPSPDPASVTNIQQTVAAMKVDATDLPPTVGAILANVGDRAVTVANGGLRENLDARYQQEVLTPCLAAIEGRYPFNPTSAVDVPLQDFGRIFGYGGVFENFFKSSLENLVDTTRAQWTWRTDATGKSVGGSQAMLRQFQLAQRIRESFFRMGSQTPEVMFALEAFELDAASARFRIELDGVDAATYNHGPPVRKTATWPGKDANLAAATFEERAGGRPNIVFRGPWAWFRLVNAGQLQRESDVQYVIGFQAGGHQARVKLEAQSILNPYAARDWQQFRCGI
jgi:type VI secretion system protein ImpL